MTISLVSMSCKRQSMSHPPHSCNLPLFLWFDIDDADDDDGHKEIHEKIESYHPETFAEITF